MTGAGGAWRVFGWSNAAGHSTASSGLKYKNLLDVLADASWASNNWMRCGLGVVGRSLQVARGSSPRRELVLCNARSMPCVHSRLALSSQAAPISCRTTPSFSFPAVDCPSLIYEERTGDFLFPFSFFLFFFSFSADRPARALRTGSAGAAREEAHDHRRVVTQRTRRVIRYAKERRESE